MSGLDAVLPLLAQLGWDDVGAAIKYFGPAGAMMLAIGYLLHLGWLALGRENTKLKEDIEYERNERMRERQESEQRRKDEVAAALAVAAAMQKERDEWKQMAWRTQHASERVAEKLAPDSHA